MRWLCIPPPHRERSSPQPDVECNFLVIDLFYFQKAIGDRISGLMLKYICSMFLSKLLPSQFLFCPQKLISSVWLIAIIFSYNLLQSAMSCFSWFCKTVRHYLLWQKRLGVLSPKLTVLGKTDFSKLWIECECHSVCASHCPLKACLLLVVPSCLSFSQQPHFRSSAS